MKVTQTLHGQVFMAKTRWEIAGFIDARNKRDSQVEIVPEYFKPAYEKGYQDGLKPQEPCPF